MDIDIVEAKPSFSSSRRSFVPVDDAHPFDLDSYISNYEGRTAIDRLIHIISICPTLAPQAFQLALGLIQQSRDPAIYQQLLQTYDQLTTAGELKLPPSTSFPALQSTWIDETVQKNQQERSKLEVELKQYSNNLIKESVRMAHRDLGEHYRSVGEYTTAIKHYTKSREFCTTSQHVLDMCLSMLEIFIEQKSYAHITTYVFKAEAALDATAASAASNNPAPTGPTGAAAAAAAKKASTEEREKVQAKLEFANAISYLGGSNYERAAYHFLRIGPPSALGDWLGKLTAPGDIAIYGTLCALASLTRSGIKAQLLENPDFGIYVESEPYVRDLVSAYMSSNFKTTLELLDRFSTRHYLDLHLFTHVASLAKNIRDLAVTLYFKPFSSIALDRMAAAFGWTTEQTEQQVVALIHAGRIQGRVDSQNKVLLAKKTDYRADLFSRAMKAGGDIQAANRKLLLRMRLQQAELVIKAPKGHGQTLMDLMAE
ncbi:26S proteasome subunit RPN7-domain-containing protein [Flagelloscypha sp. PMI_526]|nr:26S proteasome subunit RPN7-domain-containing protein [Flagelloscypha sp. PMI_526]